MDRKYAIDEYHGASRGVTIHGTASVPAMIDLADGACRVSHRCSGCKVGNRKYGRKDPGCMKRWLMTFVETC